jgi:hypothetical protein
MKKNSPKRLEENSIQSAKFLSVLALITEMAKRLNENITKVHLKSLDSTLARAGSQPQPEISRV